MQESEATGVARAILARLKRVNSVLETVFRILAGVCLGILVTVVFIDVLFRQVINDPLLWPSEIAVLVFVWSVICGAAVSARRRAHFVIDVLPQSVAPRLNYVFKIGVIGFGLIFAFVLVYYGSQMAEVGLKRFTPMEGYPMIYHFLAFPVGGAAIFLFTIEHLFEILTGTDPDSRDFGVETVASEGEAG